MPALRATLAEKLRQGRVGRRRRQRDAVAREPRGRHLQPGLLRGLPAGRPSVGRQPVEAPLRGCPAAGRPGWRRGANRLGQPGPAQGAFQRAGGLRGPGCEDPTEPGARRQFSPHRRASCAEHRPTGRAPIGLQRRIGGQPPGLALRRRRAPAGAGPGREQPRVLPWAEPDAQLRLPSAQERQRETARPKRGRQDGRVAMGHENHAGAERLERLRRAHRRAPGDVAQRACESQMTFGRAALRHHARQQPQQQRRGRPLRPLARIRHGFLYGQRCRVSCGGRRT